jgi:cardiolipin synthase
MPEISVLIYDRAVVADLRAIQETYFAQCDRVTEEERARLPIGRRALENVARLTDSLL